MYILRSIPRVALTVAMLVTTVSLTAIAEETSDPYADKSTIRPVTELKFYQNKQGLTVANGWGDPANGAHSNYIKMAGGTASTIHTHSFSYYGVVVAGVVANEPPGSTQDHPLPAGSYWYQKADERHVTKCISQTECLFFVTAKGPFDYLPAQ
ncbi:protein of unknown function [Rhizobium sp. NFR07]|uniref:DUF4437 domain-containing protein n=1 Tax=Rhizobium sp. NFR07 TaxID=1566262 RepID=UPI0008E4645E|nr:DUF4437 domain-containing protein [Rhizobium sp. NFR07]SFB36542.1 protein of unknown function [Rhizobium sp. NFR07]